MPAGGRARQLQSALPDPGPGFAARAEAARVARGPVGWGTSARCQAVSSSAQGIRMDAMRVHEAPAAPSFFSLIFSTLCGLVPAGGGVLTRLRLQAQALVQHQVQQDSCYQDPRRQVNGVFVSICLLCHTVGLRTNCRRCEGWNVQAVGKGESCGTACCSEATQSSRASARHTRRHVCCR